ncbi:FAD-dependent oxidoreductase [Thermus sp. SYSU G05001]|uniref:FAD-dependent oxidoreductase n=1 Tax=Thermus brevis TaxID=2862456 RepID=A0ABS7A092_9DEIN|nr:FAD-dependent oxidoreductase [Thermus brevis]MBW6394609.1 FAD-dependent oxidoreductase [Thermus brevis]
MATKVLVLGGGSGGLVAANKVKRLLGREVEVTLVDKNAYHEFMPAYPWVAFGMREPEQVRRPLANLEKRGITYLQATVEALDPANNRVKTSAGELSYDYLIVSLGAEALPSPAQDSYAPWSLEGALKLREALKNFKGGRVVVGVSSPYYPCPPAPYEVAGQVEFALKVKGIRDKSTVEVFHLNPLPLAGMGPVISGKVMEILRSKGIAFHGEFEPASFEGGKVRAKDGRELAYDLLILTPPFAPNRVVRESPLAGPQGFPEVNKMTFRSTRFANVFVIGDTVNPSLMLPPAGVVAHFQGEYVAGVIASDLKGAYIGEPFNPVAMCIMDFGDNALLPQCSFEKLLAGTGMPSCGVMAVGKWVRVTKMLFEGFWFATLIE